jgi:hypothetical protein
VTHACLLWRINFTDSVRDGVNSFYRKTLFGQIVGL